VGKAQLPIDEAPLRLADARTKARVEPVLIIPRYSTSTGVSTGGGHGPGRMLDGRFLAAPFMYWDGNRFQPKQPDSHGIEVGPLFFVGQGVSINGVIIMSRDHKALWWDSLWDRDHRRVVLEPIVEESSYRKRLLSLLERDEIRGRDLTEDERNIFNLIPDFDLNVKFNADDRRMVREFLTVGYTGPAARPPH
jgi:hypothetical protein